MKRKTTKRKTTKRKPYRHLLVPTDGSPLAMKGVKAALALAQVLDARVRGVYVAATGEDVAGVHDAPLLLEHLERQARSEADEALAPLIKAAKKAGVRCAVEVLMHNQPWKGILDVARQRKCDLIVLASGRQGLLGGLILGGKTGRVLSLSPVPVLLVR